MLPLRRFVELFDSTAAEIAPASWRSICPASLDASISIATGRCAGLEQEMLQILHGHAGADVRARTAAARYLSTVPGMAPELLGAASHRDSPLALTLACISLCQAVMEGDGAALPLLAPALLNWLESGAGGSIRSRSIAYAARIQLGALLNVASAEKYAPLITETLRRKRGEAEDDDEDAPRPGSKRPASAAFWNEEEGSAAVGLPLAFVSECLLMASLALDLERARRAIGLWSSQQSRPAETAPLEVDEQEEPPRKRTARVDPRMDPRKRRTETAPAAAESPLLDTVKRILQSPVVSRRGWHGLVGNLLALIPEAASDAIGAISAAGNARLAAEFMKAVWLAQQLAPSAEDRYAHYLRQLLGSGLAEDALVLLCKDLPSLPFDTLRAHATPRILAELMAARPALRLPIVQHLVREHAHLEDIVIDAFRYRQARRFIEEAAVELSVERDWQFLVRLAAIRPSVFLHLSLRYDAVGDDAKANIRASLPMAFSNAATERRVQAFARLLEDGIRTFSPAFMTGVVVPCTAALTAKAPFAPLLAGSIKKCILEDVGFDAHLLGPIAAFLDAETDVPVLLPRIVALAGEERDEDFVRTILFRLIELGKVDAQQLFVQLHLLEPALGVKRCIAALQICFGNTAVFKPELLASAIQSMMDASETELPTLFMRTLIQSCTLHKSLSGFITGLLTRLAQRGRALWSNARNWDGFMRAARMLIPGSLPALAALPQERLEEALGQADIRAAVKEYLYAQPPSVRRRYASLMEAIQRQ